MRAYNLFNTDTQAFFFNLKPKPIQRMLDFDFLSNRKLPSVAAIIHPGHNGFHKAFFGDKEILIPTYPSISEATKKHPTATVLINFASFRSAYDTSKLTLAQPSIKTLVIVAEGIPEQQVRELRAISIKNDKVIIGPATVGALVAGTFRIGHAGGEMDNIISAKLYRPGSVGLVSKSGGMVNEFFNIISRASDGIYEGVSIGGDAYPGSTLLDHLLRYEQNPNIKLLVALGEVGGMAEYEIIQAKKEGKITKPLVMWVSGTCADIFPWEVQFGHAGAKAGSPVESARSKNQALKEAGIIVPHSFEEFENTINKQYLELLRTGIISAIDEIPPPIIPNRKTTNFTSSISDDRGEEPTYNSIQITKLIENKSSIGDIIGLLWFKKQLPAYFTKFLELSIILTADHGPAVSGAHNAIVTSRAGKDVISCLISGLATIGHRFGGAIDAASQYFMSAKDKNQAPVDFVAEMKEKGKIIPGIGHKVKSSKNPDKRVSLLIEFAKNNFPELTYLPYALDVEKVTLQKADNLILNVDGCIAALFLDAVKSSNLFTPDDIKQMVEIGYMNGLFALARTIGMIGHILDQKRLGERLYRHPTNDILYVDYKV
jgi:ATP citrate (pro-S)-lyase